jgi:hypothetical protein
MVVRRRPGANFIGMRQKASKPSAGPIDSLWKSLETCLVDAGTTLSELESEVSSINKTSKFLDSVKKYYRLRKANDEIGFYRQQIGSYQGTIYISLHTTIF